MDGSVSFAGSVGPLETVKVRAGTTNFSGAGAVEIGNLKTEGGYAAFNGGNATVNVLELAGGGVSGGAPVTVTDTFTWRTGSVFCDVRAEGELRFEAGTRELYGNIESTVGTVWNGGDFWLWDGTLTNPAGIEFAIEGDFSASLGSGSVVNDGLLVKTAGSGTASLGVEVFNGGTIRSESGTLQLKASVHGDAVLEALPGATIALGGHTVIHGNLSTSGVVTVNGASLTLEDGGTLTNVEGNSVDVVELWVAPGSAFTNLSFFTAASASNSGTLVNAGDGQFFTSFVQTGENAEFTNSGSITNTGAFEIGADTTFSSGGEFVNYGSMLNAGTLNLSGNLTSDAEPDLSGLPDSGLISNPSGSVVINSGANVSGSGAFRQESMDGSIPVTRIDGNLTLAEIHLINGELRGNGVLGGNITLGGDSEGPTALPGNSIGNLTFDGDLTVDRATFIIEVSGPTVYDTVTVTGSSTFNGGEVVIRLLGDYRPCPGDDIGWFWGIGPISGIDNLGWHIDTGSDEGGWWLWGDAYGFYDGTTMEGFEAWSADGHIMFGIANIPEPVAVPWIFGGVALTVVAAARARRQRPN